MRLSFIGGSQDGLELTLADPIATGGWGGLDLPDTVHVGPAPDLVIYRLVTATDDGARYHHDRLTPGALHPT